MKRSVAILGPTPAFLSWTLVVPCPFRDSEPRNPVDAAFRELRSLRAVSVGEIENRIVEGFCLHPDAAASDPSEATGFPVDEVYATFGGQGEATKACRGCIANVPVSVGELSSGPVLSKAGCFGWLPFGNENGSTSDFMRLLEVEDQISGNDLVEDFELAFQQTSESPFPKTTPAWFGVWSQKTFSPEQLSFLANAFSKIDSHSIASKRLVAAITIASHQKAKFVCSLMPRGHSDGTQWHIESQCPFCGATRTVTPCPVCRDDSAPLQPRRMKVLGLRPYLKLSSIVGSDGVTRLCDSYRQRQLRETKDG